MNNNSKIPLRNSIITGVVFLITGLVICYLKEFNLSNPFPILFLPLWTIIAVWITNSVTKKYYVQKEMFLPNHLETESQEYKDRMIKWKKYIHSTISSYSLFFGGASTIMCLFSILKYIDGRANISRIVIYGVSAILGIFISRLLKIHINFKEKKQNKKHPVNHKYFPRYYSKNNNNQLDQ